MHRENNIFYKAVKKDENHTTELFCNLLKYDFIRNYLLNFFNLPVEKIRYEDIDTQKRIGNIQPDILIKNDDVYCFFEIKIKDSDLQESQIEDYLKELKKEKDRKEIKMIYLIPQDYKYKDSINEIIEKEENVIKEQKSFVTRRYWEDFIRQIENSDLPKGSLLVQEFIAFLKNVLKKQDLSITLNLEEMALLQNPKDLIVAKNLLEKLYKIIDKVAFNTVEKYNDKHKNNKIDFESYDTNNEYSVYFVFEKDKNIDKKDKYILFFGLWFSIIEKHPNCINYLFSYGVNTSKNDEDTFDDKYIKNFTNEKNYETNNKDKEDCYKIKENIVKAGTWRLTKIDKYDFATENEEALINKISQELLDTLQKIIN